MNRINPPAIVRKVESLAELIAEAKAIFGEQQEARRLDLKQTLKLGGVLYRARAKCERGEWLPALDKIGVGRSAAYEAIRTWETSDSEISKCETMADLRRLWKKDAEEEEQEIIGREPGEEGDEEPASRPPNTSAVPPDEDSYEVGNEPTDHAGACGSNETVERSTSAPTPAVNGHAKTEPATPANSKPGPILCKRCQHNKDIGREVVKGCDMCKQLRPKAEPRIAQTQGDAPAGAGDDPKDAFGNSVPKNCRDVIFDPWIQDTIEFLSEWNTKLLEKRISQDIVNRTKRIPWIMAKDADDGINFMVQYGDQVIEHLKENRPVAVCPSCKGKKCPDCRQCGVVPRSVYLKLAGTEK